MTTLISWIAADQRGPSSIYLAADSRITWGDADKWDRGKKVFASHMLPLIVGYCGDVTFPIQAINQVLEAIDHGDLGMAVMKEDIVGSIVEQLRTSLSKYPSSQYHPFSIFICLRKDDGLGCVFEAHEASFGGNRIPLLKKIDVPSSSILLTAGGSGRTSFKESYLTWWQSEVKGTSRAIYSAFCDALKSGKDPKSFGPPQLVGLYRKGNGISFGSVWDGVPYLGGMEMCPELWRQNIRWYNELFEICDPLELQRAETAQRHHRPNSLV
jgi:hypothetical protein